MTWQRATTLPNDSSRRGDNSRSFCLRPQVRLFCPVHCLLVWGTVIVMSCCQVVSQSSLHYDQDRHWLSHPRAPELCAHTFSGQEGTPIKGFTLDRAFVVTTPGLAFHQNVDSLLNRGGHSTTHCHFHKYAKTHSSSKIKSYSEVLWIKDKVFMKSKLGSDFKVFKHVPSSIRCKDEMLTPEGVAQAVHLGDYLAKCYLNTIKSLSPSASSAKSVAFTVGDELLYQSVHAVLFGLLTEKQFVHAEVKKLSHHFTDDSSNSRVETQEHLRDYVKAAFKNEHHLFKDHSSPTGDRWSIDSEFGRQITAKDILSSLSLKECDKRVKDAVRISDDLIESILSLSDTHNSYLLNSSVFYNFSQSISLPFRKYLNTWISSSYKDNDFKLVSVDEMFMLSLLSAFGSGRIRHISPVSRLVIEQFYFHHVPPSQPQSSTFTRSDVLQLSSLSSPPLTSFITQSPSHPKVQEEADNEPKYSKNNLDPRSVYFRVLYNGQIITEDIPYCQSDPLVSLGLCQMPSFILALLNNEAAQFRDEL